MSMDHERLLPRVQALPPRPTRPIREGVEALRHLTWDASVVEHDQLDEVTSASKRLVEDGNERRRMAAVKRQGRTEFSLAAQAAGSATDVDVDVDACKDPDDER
jgi:hypothetical protein